MAGISREERERRRLAAEGAKPPISERLANAQDRAMIAVSDLVRATAPAGKLESRHWPGLFYDPSDPEPQQNNMLGTQDPVWSAWFERNGGKLK